MVSPLGAFPFPRPFSPSSSGHGRNSPEGSFVSIFPSSPCPLVESPVRLCPRVSFSSTPTDQERIKYSFWNKRNRVPPGGLRISSLRVFLSYITETISNFSTLHKRLVFTFTNVCLYFIDRLVFIERSHSTQKRMFSADSVPCIVKSLERIPKLSHSSFPLSKSFQFWSHPRPLILILFTQFDEDKRYTNLVIPESKRYHLSFPLPIISGKGE